MLASTLSSLHASEGTSVSSIEITLYSASALVQSTFLKSVSDWTTMQSPTSALETLLRLASQSPTPTATTMTATRGHTHLGFFFLTGSAGWPGNCWPGSVPGAAGGK